MATMFCTKNTKLEEQRKVKVGWRGKNPPKNQKKKNSRLEEERGGDGGILQN